LTATDSIFGGRRRLCEPFRFELDDSIALRTWNVVLDDDQQRK